MSQTSKDECLEYKERLNLSDNEVMDHLKESGIVTISALQRLKKNERDDIISKMKDMQGVTIRQLARITGISKSMIDRL